MDVPLTSTTLLRGLASSAQNARWGEFIVRYEPLMKAYLATHFPTLEADDIVQETLLALMKALPRYTYNPEENGFFHNYLTGIVKRKALDSLAANQRVAEIKERAQNEAVAPGCGVHEQEDQSWRFSVYEIALQQMLGDEEISVRDKEIFTRTSIKGDSPEKIAEDFGVTVNVVYLTKSRLMKRLRETVKALKEV